MQHLFERRQVGLCQAQAFGHAIGGIGRGRRRLRRDDLAIDAPHEIREGASDINSDNIHEAFAFMALGVRDPGVSRRSAMRTSSLKVTAMTASEPIRANRGAGL